MGRVGGAGSIKGHEATLSLVVNQTREVHEQLELLLRRHARWAAGKTFALSIDKSYPTRRRSPLNQHQRPGISPRSGAAQFARTAVTPIIRVRRTRAGMLRLRLD